MAQPRENLTKQVFVAYAYNLYDQRDYRKVYASLEKSFGIKFIFADEKITNMHILQSKRLAPLPHVPSRLVRSAALASAG